MTSRRNRRERHSNPPPIRRPTRSRSHSQDRGSTTSLSRSSSYMELPNNLEQLRVDLNHLSVADHFDRETERQRMEQIEKDAQAERKKGRAAKQNMEPESRPKTGIGRGRGRGRGSRCVSPEMDNFGNWNFDQGRIGFKGRGRARGLKHRHSAQPILFHDHNSEADDEGGDRGSCPTSGTDDELFRPRRKGIQRHSSPIRSADTSSSEIYVPRLHQLPLIKPSSIYGSVRSLSTAQSECPEISASILETFATHLKAYPWGVCIEKYLVDLQDFVSGRDLNESSISSYQSEDDGPMIEPWLTSCLWDKRMNNYGYESFDKLVMDFPDVFLTLSSPLGHRLIFPASKREQILKMQIENDADPLFRYIWKEVKNLLRHHGGILPLSEISGLLSQLFCEKVDPCNWVVNRDLKYYFYYWCYKKLENPEEYFVEWSIPPPSRRGPDHARVKGRTQAEEQESERVAELDRQRRLKYVGQVHQDQVQLLIEFNPKNPLILEYKIIRDERHKRERASAEQIQVRKKHDARLETEKFARHGAKVENLQDEIKPGDVVVCLDAWTETPGNFYVNSYLHWDALERLMVRMRKVYEQFDCFHKHNPSIPWPEHLVPGFYVAVRTKSNGKYHRAKIISKIGTGLYSVFLIDYGETLSAQESDIRYLRLEFLHDMKAQAVKCVAHLGDHYNRRLANGKRLEYNKGRDWTEEEGQMFREMIRDKPLGIQFKELVEIEGQDSWVVFIHVLDEAGKSIEIHHVERQVLRKSQGSYILSGGEKTETKAELDVRKDFRQM